MNTARRFDAVEILNAACIKHRVQLAPLVAETALWAHPKTHQRAGAAAVHPGIRRLHPGQGEKRGVVNGVGLDNNSYANGLIKRSLGLDPSEVVGFECCHVWPHSCYDTRYHTVIANLMLIPAALASLTDYDPAVQAALQYRSFELYQWHPDERPAPVKPPGYPENWQAPQPDPKLLDGLRHGLRTSPKAGVDGANREPVKLDRLRLWATKPGSNVHRIIGLMCDHGLLSRDQLVRKIYFSRNPYGAVASMMTNDGNSYGLVFVEIGGRLRIHPQIDDTVRRLWNRPSAR